MVRTKVGHRKQIIKHMPRFDGTGPAGQGPMTGRGMGPCGRGFGRGRGCGFGRFFSPKNELSALEAEEKALKEEL
ncbi:MAG: DUF5320 domain-containing protein, partial [Candidatus Colwellbacteria bacterium]|nr:DUF5320 domain-containing protein [Candidatus Colwellbacteria bacterium]